MPRPEPSTRKRVLIALAILAIAAIDIYTFPILMGPALEEVIQARIEAACGSQAIELDQEGGAL